MSNHGDALPSESTAEGQDRGDNRSDRSESAASSSFTRISGRSRCSDGASSSSASNTEEGKFLLSNNLRSILVNKMTFEVFVGINQNSVDSNQNDGGSWDVSGDDVTGNTSNSYHDSYHQDETVPSQPRSNINCEFLQQIIPDFSERDGFWNGDHDGLLNRATTGDGTKSETDITFEMASLLRGHFKDHFQGGLNAVPSTVDPSAEDTSTADPSTADPSTADPSAAAQYDAFPEANVLPKPQGGKKPRLDISITKGDKLIAFSEVGIISAEESSMDLTKGRQIDVMFWSKKAQALKYIERVYDKDGSVWIFDKKNGKKEKKTFKATGPLIYSVLVLDKYNTIGRMAIFSAEPKPDHGGFRVALIWRKEFSTSSNEANKKQNLIDHLDHAYGAFIAAVKYAADRSSEEDTNWKYLGPDCIKVTTADGEQKVLRVYDNRVRSTPRSPNVYLDFPELKDTTTKVLHFLDDDNKNYPPLKFGDNPAEDSQRKWSMLFNAEKKFKGHVQVIAVPFQKGSHICKNITQAYKTANALKNLHDAGFVHGDIRGCNCIFGDKKSTIIDFDFGGPTGKVSYPRNYNGNPRDGTRVADSENCIRITKEHDFKALVDILFNKHKLGYHDKSLLDESVRKDGDEEKVQEIGKLLDEKWSNLDDLVSCLQTASTHKPDLPFTPTEVYKEFVDKFQTFINQSDESNKNDRDVAGGAATAPSAARKRLPKKTPEVAQCSPFDVPITRVNTSSRDTSRSKKRRTENYSTTTSVLGDSFRENRQPGYTK